jgi:hypothetical protein
LKPGKVNLFFARNVRTTWANWERVERICHGEEVRFARRLGKGKHDYAKHLVKPFDPENWRRDQRRTRSERFREYYRRVRREIGPR